MCLIILFHNQMLSLIHCLALSAAVRVVVAHTNCSQHNDSPLPAQTRGAQKHSDSFSLLLSVLYSSEYSVQLQMHQLLLTWITSGDPQSTRPLSGCFTNGRAGHHGYLPSKHTGAHQDGRFISVSHSRPAE